MERTSNPVNPALEKTSGWINGFIGVVIFSGSLPATRLAVLEFDPVFLTVARAAIAGVLAAALLWLFRERRPAARTGPQRRCSPARIALRAATVSF